MKRTPLQALDLIKKHVYKNINSKLDARDLVITSDVKYDAEWITLPNDDGTECRVLNIKCSFEANEKEPETVDNQ